MPKGRLCARAAWQDLCGAHFGRDEGKGLVTEQSGSPKGARTMSDHKAEDMKGRLKKAVGDVTGDKALQREGKIDQASAATKKTIDDAADVMKGVVNPKE